MSVYLFKTEEWYGGATKVFKSLEEATTHLELFFKETDHKVDAVIEKHDLFEHIILLDKEEKHDESYLIATMGDKAIVGNNLSFLKMWPTNAIVKK